MKIIELRRHSTKSGPGDTDLSSVGIELARKKGAEKLVNKKFTLLYQSPLKRTQDTLKIMKEAAGDFPDVDPENFLPHMEVSQTEEAMHLWRGACHRAEKIHQDMMSCVLQEEAETAGSIARAGAASFQKWLAALPENTHALVIGHSPFLELIAFGLFGRSLPQLQPCEGFRIIQKRGELYLETELG